MNISNGKLEIVIEEFFEILGDGFHLDDSFFSIELVEREIPALILSLGAESDDGGILLKMAVELSTRDYSTHASILSMSTVSIKFTDTTMHWIDEGILDDEGTFNLALGANAFRDYVKDITLRELEQSKRHSFR